MQTGILNSRVLECQEHPLGMTAGLRRLVNGLLRYRQSQDSLRPALMRHVPERVWRRHSALLMSRVDD